MLGLAPDDFRVIGLALAEFATEGPCHTTEELDQARAVLLHEQLTGRGYLTAARTAAAGPAADHHVLRLDPDAFRVVGLALTRFAASPAANPDDEDLREQAEVLHAHLADWGYLPAEPEPR